MTKHLTAIGGTDVASLAAPDLRVGDRVYDYDKGRFSRVASKTLVGAMRWEIVLRNGERFTLRGSDAVTVAI